MNDISESRSAWPNRGAQVVLLAWIAMLGFDFFLHGALLASLYAKPSPFLLPAVEAFRRIPIGYLSFLILAVLLVWILSAVGVRGMRRGLIAGAGLGGLVWTALGLGMYSISTASPVLLLAWAAGQGAEMAYAGAIVGWALQGGSLRKHFVSVLAATLGLALLTFVAQSLGLAPEAQLIGGN